jgi:DNA polymerase-3 subunit alpha
VLAATYGVILYQEQVMQIAQVLAGYTLGGADLLRRAMGKKKPEEMAKQRSVFIDGAVARGVNEGTARHIFDLMEKFAGYGFNKSHSAAYAVLSYQTAWLKAHHPAAFMAAVLSADMDRTDKVVTLIDECQRMGLEVEPPDVNASQYMFTVSGPAAIRYGLGAIKGVGEAAVESMIAERVAQAPYRSLRDLCRRLDPNRVNRRVVEALIRSGALDGLGANRATLMHELPKALQAADQSLRAIQAGQTDLFGPRRGRGGSAGCGRRGRGDAARLERSGQARGRARDARPLPDRSPDRRVRARAQAHRERPHRGRRGRAAVGAGDGGWRGPGRSVTLAGLVLEIRRRAGRTSFILDDRSGRIEVTLFDDVFQQYRA